MRETAIKILQYCEATTADLELAVNIMSEELSRLLRSYDELPCTPMKPYIDPHGAFEVPEVIYIAIANNAVYGFLRHIGGMSLIADSSKGRNASSKSQIEALKSESVTALPEQKPLILESLSVLESIRETKPSALPQGAVYMSDLKLQGRDNA